MCVKLSSATPGMDKVLRKCRVPCLFLSGEGEYPEARSLLQNASTLAHIPLVSRKSYSFLPYANLSLSAPQKTSWPSQTPSCFSRWKGMLLSYLFRSGDHLYFCKRYSLHTIPAWALICCGRKMHELTCTQKLSSFLPLPKASHCPGDGLLLWCWRGAGKTQSAYRICWRSNKSTLSLGVNI